MRAVSRGKTRKTWASMVVTALIAVGLSPVMQTSAAAETSSGLQVSLSAPSPVLAGSDISINLGAHNSGSSEYYNLGASMLAPSSASFISAGLWGTPRVYPEGTFTVDAAPYPSSGYQLWVWEDAVDLPPGATFSDAVTFSVPSGPPGDTSASTTDPLLFPVGSSVNVQAAVHSSTEPRYLPVFVGSTGVSTPEATSATEDSSLTSRDVLLSAISVSTTQSQHSENEFLRGAHDQSAIFKVSAKATSLASLTDVTLVDYLPASLEFLGCGGVDNSSMDWAPVDPTVNEYPGSSTLASTPSVPGCGVPDSVETVVADPATAVEYSITPGKVYTKVTWHLGTLKANEQRDIFYRAAVPLYENEMFSAPLPTTAPAGTLPPQAANLDNNTGPSTRQGSTTPNAAEWSLSPINDGAALLSVARATGHYQGTVRVGTDRDVYDLGSWSGTVMDAALTKTVDTATFSQGGLASYSLTLRTGEYTTLSTVALVDKIPNGLCPSVPVGTTWEGNRPSDCVSGSITGATADRVVVNADGTMLLFMTPTFSDPLPENSTFTVSYEALMRSSYEDQGIVYGPTTAGDRFSNEARLLGSTDVRTALSDLPSETGQLHVWDNSARSIGTHKASIGKKVLLRSDVTSNPSDPCAQGGAWLKETGDFRLGDTVCFELDVTFPSDVYTRNPELTDFLPANLDYAGYAIAAGSHDAPVQIEAGQRFTALIGTVGPGGDRYVPAGARLKLHVWGTVNDGAVRQAVSVDKASNLMKYRQNSVSGEVFFLRDQADFHVLPAPATLLKGVESVTDTQGATSSTRPASSELFSSGEIFGSNRDGLSVLETETVRYRLDLGSSYDIENATVWDILPPGITKASVSNATHAGRALDPSDPGYPSSSDLSGRSVIIWDSVTVGPSGETLRYDMLVPSGTGVQSTLNNTAYITSYHSETNGPAPYQVYIPEGTPDTSLATDANVDSAGTYDSSSISIPSARLTDQVYSEIFDSPFNDSAVTTPASLAGSTQVVKGEWTTFFYSVTVPAHTSVKNASLTGALPSVSNWIVDPVATKAYIEGSEVALDPSGHFSDPVLGGVFTLNSSTGALAFPSGAFSNTGDQDRTYSVSVMAYIKASASWQHAPTTARKHVASFSSAGASTLTDSASVYLVAPQVSLSKTHNDSDSIVRAGQDVTYTLRASASGSRPLAYDTVVTDCVPSGLSVTLLNPPGATTASTASDPTCENGQGTLITWNIGTMTPSSSASLTYHATVAPASAAGHKYYNSARLTTYSLDSSAASRRASFTSTASRTITVEKPVVTKSVSNPAPVVGEKVTYTVDITVPADVNLYSPVIKDQVPAGLAVSSIDLSLPATITTLPGATLPTGSTGAASILSWPLENIDSSPISRTITITYTGTVLNADSKNGDVLTNLANLEWRIFPEGDPSSLMESSSAASSVTVKEPSVVVTKTVNGSASHSAAPGEVFTYQLQVTNNGTSTAYALAVNDLAPAGVVVASSTADMLSLPNGDTQLTWLLGPLAPNASVLLTYTAELAPSQQLDGTILTNTASASYRSHDGSSPFDPSNVRDYTSAPSSAYVTPRFPRLSITKTPSSPVAAIGEGTHFTVKVSNTGTDTAYGVRITDLLPDGFEYDLNSQDGAPAGTSFNANGSTLTWDVSTALPAGASFTLTYTATPSPSYPWNASNTGSTVKHTNTVQATAFDASGASGWGASLGAPHPYYYSEQADVVIHRTDLSLTKTPSGPFVAGARASWKIDVSNSMSADPEASKITVKDVLPSNMDVATVQASGLGWYISGTNPASNEVEITHLGPLTPGQSAPTLTVSAVIDPATSRGTEVTNTATVSGSTFETALANNTDSAAATVTTEADLAVGVSTPDPDFTPGLTHDFSISVNNIGPSVSRAPFSIQVEIPEGMNPVSATLAGNGWSCSSVNITTRMATCTFNGSDLGVGSPAPALNLSGQAFPSWSAPLVAHASITSWTTQEPLNPAALVNNHAQANASTAVFVSDLKLDKSTLTTFAPAGQEVAYRVSVTNQGPSDARNVQVVDLLPKGVSLVVASVPSSWSVLSTSPEGDSTRVTFSKVSDSGVLRSGDGDTLTYTVSLTPDLLGEITNTATVSSSAFDPQPGNNTDSVTLPVQALADLAVRITPSASSYLAGANFSWNIDLLNNGPAWSRPSPEVTIDFPSGFDMSTFTSSPGWACTTTARSALCSYPQSLRDGQNAPTLVVATKVPSGWSGSIEADVTITHWATPEPSGPSYLANNLDNGLVLAGQHLADLGIVKTLMGSLTPGLNASYQLRVSNLGPSDAQDVTVEDALPPGVSYAEGTLSPGWTLLGLNTTPDNFTHLTFLKSAEAALTAGSQVTLSYQVKVSPSALDPVTNTAVVSSSTDDPDQGNNLSEVTTQPTPRADLQVSLATGSTYTSGLPHTWTLKIANNGPSTSQAPFRVRLTTPSGLDLTSALASGDGWTCTPDVLDLLCTFSGPSLQPAASAPALTLEVPTLADRTAEIVLEAEIVSWTTPEPTGLPIFTTNNHDTAPAVASVQVSDLSMLKELSSPTLSSGREARYTLTVTNHGPSLARNAQVHDILPKGLTLVTDSLDPAWQLLGNDINPDGTTDVTLGLGDMAVGALRITFSVQVDAAVIGQVTNTASVSSDSTDPDPTNNTDSYTAVASTLADLGLTITPMSGSYVSGEMFSWQVDVNNLGPAVSRAPFKLMVVLPDGLDVATFTPSGDDWVCQPALTHEVECAYSGPDLTVGASAPALTLTGKVLPSWTEELIANAKITFWTTPEPVGTTELNNNVDAAVVATGTQRADLELRKSTSPEAEPGTSLAYGIHVLNNGPSDAQGVTITDTLPLGVAFSSLSEESQATWSLTSLRDTTSGQEVTFSLAGAGTLKASEEADLAYLTEVSSDLTGIVVNRAVVHAATDDPNLDNNSAQALTLLTPSADLELNKKATEGPHLVGDKITYTLTLTNQGPSDATDVKVTDPIPVGFSTPTASGEDMTFSISGGVLTASLNSPLKPGQTVSFTVEGILTNDAYPSLTNRAEASSQTPDPNPSNNKSEVEVEVSSPDLLLQKRASTSAPVAGTILTYTLTLTNHGNASAQDAKVVDPLPSGLILVDVHASEGAVCDPTASVLCSWPTLQPGETVTVQVTVKSALSARGLIVNTATASTAGEHPSLLGDNTASSRVHIAAPALPQTGSEALKLGALALAFLLLGAGLIALRRFRR